MSLNATIPLFPLGTVLFPGGYLPLQIFEVRYLDMVRRCQKEGTPFGVVSLSAGHEVQQRDPANGEQFRAESFAPLGTLAHITEVQQPQPGLLFIACSGGQRFRVLQSEKLKHGLWMAETELLPLDVTVPVPAELQGIAQALQGLDQRLQQEQPAQWRALAANGPQDPCWQDAGWVANRWAELLPLPPAHKQRLLALDSPLLRLELVGDALETLGIAT